MNSKKRKEQWMDDAVDFLTDIYNEIKTIVDRLNINNKTNSLDINSTIEFLWEWLRFLDGVLLLFKYGRVDVAQVLVRSMYEITLQLYYLLEEKSTIKEKAIYYVAFSELKKYSSNEKLTNNKEKAGYNTKIGINVNDKILRSLKNNENKGIKEAYEYFEQKSLIGRDLSNFSWYAVYMQSVVDKTAGDYNSRIEKVTISRLGQMAGFSVGSGDNKVLIHSLIYNQLSRQAHGFNAKDSCRIYDGAQEFRLCDCLQNGLWQLDIIEKIELEIIKIIHTVFLNILGDIDKNKIQRLNDMRKKLNELSNEYKGIDD